MTRNEVDRCWYDRCRNGVCYCNAEILACQAAMLFPRPRVPGSIRQSSRTRSDDTSSCARETSTLVPSGVLLAKTYPSPCSFELSNKQISLLLSILIQTPTITHSPKRPLTPVRHAVLSFVLFFIFHLEERMFFFYKLKFHPNYHRIMERNR